MSKRTPALFRDVGVCGSDPRDFSLLITCCSLLCMCACADDVFQVEKYIAEINGVRMISKMFLFHVSIGITDFSFYSVLFMLLLGSSCSLYLSFKILF